MSQIAGALDEAHGKGIVHRDLKPENVLLARHAGVDDFVKLLDFGIAKRTIDSRAGVPSPTHRGAVVGSIGYMSPEQLLGRPVDGRTDVYALGVIAYEMITGRSPFTAPTSLEVVSQHLMAEPYPFEGTPAGSSAPWSMRRAVLRALAKDPLARQPTALVFWEELRLAPLTRRSGPAAAPLASAPTLGGGAWNAGAPPSLARASGDQSSEPPYSVTSAGSRSTVLVPARGLSLPSLLVGALAAVALVAAGMLLHHCLEEPDRDHDRDGAPANTAAASPPLELSTRSSDPPAAPLPPAIPSCSDSRRALRAAM